MYNAILILFLIGHILGDFYFQWTSLAAEKNESMRKLLLHCLIYLIAMGIVTIPIFNIITLKYAVFIAVAHLIVDFLKFRLKYKYINEKNKEVKVYILDQIIHIAVIVVFVILMAIFEERINYEDYFSYDNFIYFSKFISWLLMILIIINPCKITVRKVLSGFTVDDKDEGKPNAGALIGILERGIVLTLLSVGQYAAIGFVLTAKSIARYKKMSEDIAFAEYYLIGTLLSNLLVILPYILIF